MSQGRGVKEGDDGPGVDTDFILYVTAKTTRSCGKATIAYAAPCQLEQALDRLEHTALSTHISTHTYTETCKNLILIELACVCGYINISPLYSCC